MFCAGLVSITFRKLAPVEIVGLAAQAGLDGIEWGGDVHVPQGDLRRAREVGQLTAAAGLRVLAYGSYYRVGDSEGSTFESMMATALELGAKIIRVWAGRRDSARASADYWRQVVDESQRIGAIAAKAGVVIAYEFHGNTLTDTPESAVRLLTETSCANIRSYWQPPQRCDFETRLASLKAVLPWLTNVHVFHWTAERRPLAEGLPQWRRYLQVIKSTGRDHALMLEFVKDDQPQNLLSDAETLKNLINNSV